MKEWNVRYSQKIAIKMQVWCICRPENRTGTYPKGTKLAERNFLQNIDSSRVQSIASHIIGMYKGDWRIGVFWEL